MFAQVNRTLHRAQGGLGIGLALVKRLVELHGGSIAAQSPGLGAGSTFTVRLPSVEAPEIAAEPEAAPVTACASQRRRRQAAASWWLMTTSTEQSAWRKCSNSAATRRGLPIAAQRPWTRRVRSSPTSFSWTSGFPA